MIRSMRSHSEDLGAVGHRSSDLGIGEVEIPCDEVKSNSPVGVEGNRLDENVELLEDTF